MLEDEGTLLAARKYIEAADKSTNKFSKSVL